MGKKRQRQSKGQPSATDAPTKGQNFDNWISNLAKQASDPSAKTQLSKEERIERRAEKKRKRQNQKTEGTSTEDDVKKEAPAKKKAATTSDADDTATLTTTQQNRVRIKAAAKAMIEAKKESNVKSSQQRYTKPFEGFEPVAKKRNARGSKRWDEETVQPRPRDYGGIGLALPSLFLSFDDPAFVRRLEEEFREHIEGFFGKQRTKAMKKQLDGNMLWRKMSNIKSGNQKVDGKKLASMSPDERVEAMLKAGLL